MVGRNGFKPSKSFSNMLATSSSGQVRISPVERSISMPPKTSRALFLGNTNIVWGGVSCLDLQNMFPAYLVLFLGLWRCFPTGNHIKAPAMPSQGKQFWAQDSSKFSHWGGNCSMASGWISVQWPPDGSKQGVFEGGNTDFWSLRQQKSVPGNSCGKICRVRCQTWWRLVKLQLRPYPMMWFDPFLIPTSFG